jgi:hypothetical protein
MKNLTNEVLQQYFTLHQELADINELTSEQARTVQDQFGHIKHKVQVGEKDVEKTEKELWQEIFYMGLKNNEASKILRKKYPDVFDNAEKGQKKAIEIKTFELAKLGFDFQKMNGGQFIKLVQALIDMKK